MRTYLSSSVGFGQFFLKQDEESSKESHEEAMASITKHDCKQERERDDGVRDRGHFLVGCHSIRIHNGLEPRRELVGAKKSWRLVIS